MDFQDTGDLLEYRLKAKQAALDFVKTYLPKWTVKGAATHNYFANVYRVFLDIEQDKRRRTLELVVTQFYSDTGEPYWKANTVNQSIKDALHDEEDFKNLKELNDLKNPPPQEDGEDPR